MNRTRKMSQNRDRMHRRRCFSLNEQVSSQQSKEKVSFDFADAAIMAMYPNKMRDIKVSGFYKAVHYRNSQNRLPHRNM